MSNENSPENKGVIVKIHSDVAIATTDTPIEIVVTDEAWRDRTNPFFVHQTCDRVNHIYIAGPMTGIEDYNFPAFHAAAEELRAAGFTVHNPADHGLVPGAQRDDYLRYDFRELLLCEHIYFLPNWQHSLGAREEYNLAVRFKIRMHFHPEAQDLVFT